jgi:hypothetical protein
VAALHDLTREPIEAREAEQPDPVAALAAVAARQRGDTSPIGRLEEETDSPLS